jgi:hypothetical protein
MKEFLKKDISESLNDYLHEHPIEDDNFTKTYIGIVIDNKDPQQFGRCKIRVHGIHDEFTPEDLPWSIPEFPLNFTTKGSFMVPEIGTTVYVKFDDGDLYEPIYFGKLLDREHLDYEADHTEDYPDSVIFYETKNGDYFKINRLKGEYIVKTGGGVFLKFSENGDIELTNTSSENGDVKLNIKGNFDIDQRYGNYKLITQEHSIDAFSDVSIISNGSVTTQSLDDNTIETNRDFNVTTGNRISLEARSEIKQESISNKIAANVIELLPATIETTTINVDGVNESVPTEFEVSIGKDKTKVVYISVIPDIQGGPFNCLPFDPLTGAIHSGRIATGVLNPIGFGLDGIERQIEIEKLIAAIETKYVKTSATYISTIARKYASIDSQAQVLASVLTGNSILLEQKQKDLDTGLSEIQTKKELEIQNVEIKYGDFLKEPIFGTKYTGQESLRYKYDTITIPENEIKAKIDLTGKSTALNLNCGNGLIGDDI